ncbi:MAG: T9SS type A sorting domain-containing protein [Crocinitomicaceae bacterium]|nr:T9SS type A sorting domain-containing protein [Crocinitomicaceae bacterium]MBK6952368.1 T9SS type A sorting domain-containing protein [Crocinitomicaceae bacterium]
MNVIIPLLLSTIRIYESPAQGPYVVKFYDVSGTLPVLAYTAVGFGGINYASGICNGDYEIIVNNSVGDSIVIPFIYDYSPVSISVIDLQNATPGNNDGEISVSANDGVGPFHYSFNETGPWQAISYYSNLAPGNYTLYATDSMSCIAETDTTISLILGNEEPEKNALLIYPNPTRDNLSIIFSGDFIYTLFDLNGRKILSGDGINEVILNLANIPAGIYLIEILSESQNHLAKVLVQ